MRPRPAFRALLPLALFALPGCTPEPTLVKGTAADHGEALFNDPTIAETTLNEYSCATCHATTAAADPAGHILPGAPLEGVTLRPSYWGGQELELLRSINHCLYYFMLKDKPWEAGDTDAEAMYAYLDSISRSGKGTDAAAFTVAVQIQDIPAGDAARGGAVFEHACHLCHGTVHTGEGKLVHRAPKLPDQTVEAHPSPAYSPTDRRLVFIEKTRHGAFLGYGGEMPPFSIENLSDGDIGDLLSYLGLY